jgi:hypothetical protein
MVDAPYAAPAQGLPIRSVTSRLFRGYCRQNDTLEDARVLIFAQQSAILALINDEDRLNSNTKKKTTKYIGKFFDIIQDPKDFKKLVIEKCRK